MPPADLRGPRAERPSDGSRCAGFAYRSGWGCSQGGRPESMPRSLGCHGAYPVSPNRPRWPSTPRPRRSKRRRGRDRLRAGEPDFPTPAHIVDAAVEACRDPSTHKYSPTAGLPALRAAVATKTARDSGSHRPAGAGARDQRWQARRLQHLPGAARPGRRGAPPGALLDHVSGADPDGRRRAGGARPTSAGFRVTVDQLEEAARLAPRRCSSCLRPTRPGPSTRRRRSRRSGGGRSSTASGC